MADLETQRDESTAAAEQNGDETNDIAATDMSAANAANENALPITDLPPTQSKAISAKTTAGFLLEDSEEEDADETPYNPQQNGNAESNGHATAQAENVQISSAATQDDQTSAIPSTLQSVTAAADSEMSTSAVTPVSSVLPVPIPASIDPLNVVVSDSAATPVQNGVNNLPASTVFERLPHDKVGQLEDRINDDTRADPDAWMSLIAYYKEKDQLDGVRKTYDRFVEVYPTSASIWLDYLHFEQVQDDHAKIDQILSRALMKTPNVDLWLFYINVLRRRHPLLNDTDGTNRGTISKAFEFVLDKVGIDPDSGKVWREYIDFIKDGPGTLIANSAHWQDQQKLDLLRKAYQKAVAIPTDELSKLWKEYNTLETTYNRAAARKLIDERSPHYMTARVAKTQLDERLIGLDRRSLPILPPLPGYAGDVEFGAQVGKWRDWINWEKSDELVLKQDEDLEGYRKRVDYAYKQATMALRFYPEIWFEAAAWCFEQGTEHWKKEGEGYLDGGIIGTPESHLLALRKADIVEMSFRGKGDSDEIAIANGHKLDEIYEKCHKALYALRKKYQQRQARILAEFEKQFDSNPEQQVPAITTDYDSDDDKVKKPLSRDEQKVQQQEAIKAPFDALQEVLKQTISYVWIAKMQAFNRIQGSGMPKAVKKGFRGIFAECRPRGALTSDVFVTSAMLENYCASQDSAVKIFERGLKLFPTDEFYILEYIKYLVAKSDLTNARAVFQTSITKITRVDTDVDTASAKADKDKSLTREQQRAKCRPLLTYMHTLESKYGDLNAIQRIEKRMAELYPEEPEILRFVGRFDIPGFDGLKIPLAISPVQIRPKLPFPPAMSGDQAINSIEGPRSPQPGQLLLGAHGPYVASPKRPLEDSDDGTPNRKFMRGDSPLKGAAGRRIATAAGAAASAVNMNAPAAMPAIGAGIATGGGSGFVTKNYIPGQTITIPAPQPLPPALYGLLSILPPASAWQATRFDPAKMVALIQHIDLSRATIN